MMAEKIYARREDGQIVGLSPLGWIVPVIFAVGSAFFADYVDPTEGFSPSSALLGAFIGLVIYGGLSSQIGRRVYRTH